EVRRVGVQRPQLTSIGGGMMRHVDGAGVKEVEVAIHEMPAEGAYQQPGAACQPPDCQVIGCQEASRAATVNAHSTIHSKAHAALLSASAERLQDRMFMSISKLRSVRDRKSSVGMSTDPHSTN